MTSRTDLNAFLAAMLLHAGFAFALVKVSRSPPKGPNIVELDIRKKEPPPKPAAPLPPEEPPPPPKLKAPKAQPKVQAPIPNQAPKEPPKEPPPVVTGISADSVTDGPGVAFNVGNTTIGDPNHAPKKAEEIRPLPPAPPAAVPGPVFKPASALEIKSEPDWDEESCRVPYPDGPAKDEGIEGDTMLRVEIDERGKVHDVKKLKGVGHGLDEQAIKAIKYKCRFGPAKNTAGKPVPFTITYVYHWVIER